MRVGSSSGRPVLIAFSGLPGTGKTTLARLLSSRLGAAYFRIDSIEEAIKYSALKPVSVEDAGYRAAAALIVDNLKGGRWSVADSVNPVAESRALFAEAARQGGGRLINAEILCSDRDEHRHRVEYRHRTDKSEYQPDWHAVLNRHYEAWQEPPLRIDTAGLDQDACLREMLERLDNEFGVRQVGYDEGG